MNTSYDKSNKLQNEFREFQLNPNDQISKEDLFSILDQKLGRQFDRNVAEQLYERMQKNYDGSSTVEEFISVVCQADEVLTTKIANSKNYLEDFHRQRRNAASKLEEVRRTEVLNQFNIMEGSMLNVTIDSAKIPQNQFKQENQASCLLQVQDQSYQTMWVNTMNLEWNEPFNFTIQTGKESLSIRLLAQVTNSSQPRSLGVVIISLKALEDQQKHEEWVQLHSEEMGEQVGSIQLSLQWLHSRTKYLSEVVKKWDEQIKIQDEDLNDYQRDLNVIYEPFKSFRNNPTIPITLTGALDFPQADNQMFVKNEPMQQKFSAAPVPQYQPLVQQDQNNYQPQPINQNLPIEAVTSFFDSNNQYYLHRIILTIILGLAILLSFYKNTLIDMILFAIFLNWNLKNEMNYKKIIIMTAVMGAIFIQELCWIISLSPNWWSNNNAKTNFKFEAGIKKYTVILSYFQLIAKFIGLGLFGKSLFDAHQEQTKLNQQQYQQYPVSDAQVGQWQMQV